MLLSIGSTYLIKHSSGLVDAVLLSVVKIPGYPWGSRRAATRYHFRNLKTGCEVVLKSTQKIHSKI